MRCGSRSQIFQYGLRKRVRPLKGATVATVFCACRHSVFSPPLLFALWGRERWGGSGEVISPRSKTRSETEVGYVNWSQDTTGGAASGRMRDEVVHVRNGRSSHVTSRRCAFNVPWGTGLLSNGTNRRAGTAKWCRGSRCPGNPHRWRDVSHPGLSAGITLCSPITMPGMPRGGSSDRSIFRDGVSAGQSAPSIRAATNAAARWRLEFMWRGERANDNPFSADTLRPRRRRCNVMVNGFEIDTPNSTRIAQAPVPADGDEHVDADAGSTLLSWSAPTAGNAASYDVYFGTSQVAVKDATRASAEFRRNQTGMNYTASGIVSALTYFWRVDAIDAVGNVTRGTVWYFRPRHLAFPGAEGWGRSRAVGVAAVSSR